MMVRRLKSLFFVLVLSVSVFSGTPLLAGDSGAKMKVCPMKCCKKSAKQRKPQTSDSKSLCRVLVCSQNMPTGTNSTAQVNLAPVIISSERLSLFEILYSTTPKESGPTSQIEEVRFDSGQPKYIKHQRILV